MATVIIPKEYINKYEMRGSNIHHISPMLNDIGVDVKNINCIEGYIHGGYYFTRLTFNYNGDEYDVDIDLTVAEVCVLIADAMTGNKETIQLEQD